MVQWLGLHSFTDKGQFLVEELGFHKPCGMAKTKSKNAVRIIDFHFCQRCKPESKKTTTTTKKQPIRLTQTNEHLTKNLDCNLQKCQGNKSQRRDGSRPKEKVSSVQFSRSVMSNSLRPHELQNARVPCPSPTPGVHSNSRPSKYNN